MPDMDETPSASDLPIHQKRDPEDRPTSTEEQLREKSLDKTLADSFPTSDPPSTNPDPVSEEAELMEVMPQDQLLQDLVPGSWAAVSSDQRSILAVGETREEAAERAHLNGHSQVVLLQVPADPDAPHQAAA